MGVPAFFRWLSERYPKMMTDVIELEAEVIGATELPVDITQPNPNGVEFDNLYLDMNGIIHPCFHPEDKPAPTTETEVFQNIFEYIDRLVAMVRPRKVVYMAIDGVAPRAKMNQQRSRRFRAAGDREEQKALEEKLRAEFKAQGVKLPERKGEGETFDSNVITPGTEFMDRLAMALQWYIHKRLNDAEGWRNMSVVLSDANTPGEGEHKFMQFVREQRNRPGWNPKTVHCVYGLDADLIHLALASHEPHFYILREIVFTPKGGTKEGPDRAKAMATVQGRGGGGVKSKKPEVAKKPFQFLNIAVLREYLALEFSDLELPFVMDPERLVDDFVMMCFFVGNDFLPHMPTLDIREKGIELMIKVYRDTLPYLGGYMANGADLDLHRVGQFIAAVGQYEDKIFQARMRKMRSDKNRHLQQKQGGPNGQNGQNGRGYRGNGAQSGPAQLNRVDPKSFLANKSHAPRPPAAPPPGPPAGPPPATAAPTTAASNKNAASSLRERLAGKKAGAAEPAQPPQEANADGDKGEVKQEEATEGEGAPANGEGKTEDVIGAEGGEDATHVGQGVVLGKRGLEEDESAADKCGKIPSGVEKMSVDGEEPPVKRVSCAKEEKDSVMDLWSELTDKPNAEVEAEDPADGDAAKAEEDMTEAQPAAEEQDADAILDEVAAECCADDSTEAQEYRDQLKQQLRAKSDMFEDMIEHEEELRLGDEGWKARYYQQKFGIPAGKEQDELIAELSKSFVEGLCWVMKYYFDGVASWRWFYPFHYAPFASDLVRLEEMQITFDLGEPFQPFNQLMGVFPAGSKHALPKPLQPLFDDPNSPILDFYPKDFKVDMNGKRFAWQGVALLPFIDESRLLEATQPIIDSLPDAERRRNERRPSSLFARRDVPAGDVMEHQSQGALDAMVTMALYEDPPHQHHLPSILPGTQLPEKILTAADRPRQETLWCERHDERMRERRNGGGQYGPPGHYASVGPAGHRMARHHQSQTQPQHGRNAGGWRGGDPSHHSPPAMRPHGAPGYAAPVQPTMAPGMAPMYAQGHMQPIQGQPVQMQYQYQPEQLGGVPPGYVVMQAPGAQMMLQQGVPGQVLVAPQGYQQVAMAPQMVQPGQAGTFFAGMRPAAAQPNMHGDMQAYGQMGGSSAYGANMGGTEGRGYQGSGGYGGGGYGRGGGGGYRSQARGNRYDALRDPRSRR